MSLCGYCKGACEIKKNPAWPDPQGEISETCPRCLGTGLEREAQP